MSYRTTIEYNPQKQYQDLIMADKMLEDTPYQIMTDVALYSNAIAYRYNNHICVITTDGQVMIFGVDDWMIPGAYGYKFRKLAAVNITAKTYLTNQ